MKTHSNRRNFIQKTILFTTGLFSAKLSSGSSAGFINSPVNNDDKSLNETMQTIHNLHTTHGNFIDKEIPDQEIELIKQACIRAANSSNMQTYSIIEVRDKELMKNVCHYVGSCMLLFCVDYNRLEASAKSLGLPYYPGHITSFITGSINTAIAAQTAVIAARSLNIDSLLTNGIHRGDMDRHWELLGLPEEHCVPLIALVLGYASEKPKHIMGRLKGKEIFHSKVYQKPTIEELENISAQYDDPELHLALNPGFKDKGHAHYLEWLFKDWLRRDTKPKESETQLLTQLKKRGFIEMQE